MDSSPERPAGAAGSGAGVVAVLREAGAAGRLGRTVLLHGPDGTSLERAAWAVAAAVLAGSGFAPGEGRHPDLHLLRPSGKMRFIRAEPTREFLRHIQMTPVAAARKVAVIVGADRLNADAANISLKTLEEPPGDTTILLLSTQPHALLATVRSRCLAVAVPADGGAPAPPAELAAWQEGFGAWLAEAAGAIAARDRAAAAAVLMGLYGLVAQAEGALDALAEAGVAKEEKEGLEEDEVAALSEGVAVAHRRALLAGAAVTLRRALEPALVAGGETAAVARRRLAAGVAALEEASRLGRYNFGFGASLEQALLLLLRAWRRG